METGKRPMKVEVLYVAECPSHPAAVRLVRDVLLEEGVIAEVREVLVRDEGMARGLGFPGSPTVRINGRDVAGESARTQAFAFTCRLYPESKQIGLPSPELVRRAVLEARQAYRQEAEHGSLEKDTHRSRHRGRDRSAREEMGREALRLL
jgi:hypothetical protein